MPLVQITDVYEEPLDLWLSQNHEGQRRYVRADDAAALAPPGAGRSGPAPPPNDENADPAAAGEASDASASNVLCEFIPPSDATPSWLASPRTGAAASASASDRRVPLPPPPGLIGQMAPVAAILPDPARARAAKERLETSRAFSSEAGAPTVFVGAPPPNLICPVCRDVFLDPVVSNDGFTRCRRCVAADASDDRFDASDLASDHEVWEKILGARILCKHALRRREETHGVAARWAYDPEGCSEAVALVDRASHEERCGYAKRTCGLPDDSADACGMVVSACEMDEHRASCPFRLVTCPTPGCDARVRKNREAQHVASCAFRTAACPNGCAWRGRRHEVVEHRGVCALEHVTCGREDDERASGGDDEGGGRCAFRGERRALATHDADCEFLPVACAHCGVGVPRRRLEAHETVHCAERAVPCELCGVSVRVSRMDEHANRFCGSGAFACAFAPYGCPFRGAREELTRHEAEDAHKHLRLCAVQIEQARGTYAEWAEEIQTVKRQFERAAKEGRERVERELAERTASEARAEEEMEALRTALTELKAHYEEEAVRLRRKAEKTAAEAEARVKDVEAENAALRTVLASKMPRAEAEAIERRFEDAFARCEAELEDAKATVARHEARWGADVARVKADVDAARAKADAAHEELLARVAAHAESDAARCDAVERELHDANKEFIEDLDELARKQREFEERWTRANEKLRGAPPRGVLVEKGLGGGGGGGGGGEGAARGFLGDASSGPGRDAKPAAALPSSGKKARGDRARGAAALLFGRGSRADPGE